MVARLHQIMSRTRGSTLDFSLPEQFELDEGQDVSSQMVIEDGIWHPYTIDFENESVLFLDMPPEVDLSQEAFVFPRQFIQATRALKVPYDELMGLAEQVSLPENIIFIFSTGRCGSTLLHQILNQAQGVYSYSEPDITTMLALLRKENGISDALAGDIVEAGSILQIYAAAPPDATHVAFKFRGQVNPLMPQYFERFPNAKMIFMYRDAVSWVYSSYHFLMKFYDDDVMSLDTLKFTFESYPDDIVAQLGQYLDLSRDRFHLAERLAVMLIFQFEMYQQYAETYTLFPLHYEDLLDNPKQVLGALLDYCNIPQSELAGALRGLERDSQEGTVAARDSQSRILDSDGEQLFLDVLRRHPVFGVENFRL